MMDYATGLWHPASETPTESGGYLCQFSCGCMHIWHWRVGRGWAETHLGSPTFWAEIHAPEEEEDTMIRTDELRVERERAAEIEILRGELTRLRSAIRETLAENAHLADGENCTLRRLVEALGEETHND